MAQTREEIVRHIIDTIHDYRADEIEPITDFHINRWIKQFSLEEKKEIVILSEVKQWLEKYYYSRNKINSLLSNFLSNEEIWGSSPINKIKNSHFLTIQTYGESQLKMVELANNILIEKYNFSISDCCSSTSYVYIDDCLFSGNRLRNDVLEWIRHAPTGVNLLIYYVAVHLRNIQNTKNAINAEAKKKNISITYHFNREINDKKLSNNPIEFFWPKKNDNEPEIEEYSQIICRRLEALKKPNVQPYIFRSNHSIRTEQIFSSPEARDLVETAFLKEGVKLTINHILKGDYETSFNSIARHLDDEKKYYIRPLGFDRMESLGFGSLFITYRNIGNNCPIVLWFECLQNSWHPLFPRKRLLW
jgi:hypothetical protein